MKTKIICGSVFSTIFLLVVFLVNDNLTAGDLVYDQIKVYFNEGVKAQKSGDLLNAQNAYQKALLIMPPDSEYRKYILNNIGVMLMKLGKDEEAEKMFNASIEIDANYKPSLINLAFIYEKKKPKLEAIQFWLKVLDIDLEKIKPKDFIIEGER